MKKHIYAGTYTGKGSEGIYRFVFEDGKLSEPSLFCRIENPKYLNSYEDKIVAVNGFKEGAGVSLIDQEGKIIDQLIFEKATSCYVACHHKRIYTANYHEGTFSVIDVTGDRFSHAQTTLIKDKGGCHQVLLHEGRILIPSLFLDQVKIYDEDLRPITSIAFPEGSGPRHGVFSKDGSYLYLVSELSNELFVIDMRTLRILDAISVLPDHEKNTAGTAAIRMSDDGQHLYVSTRGKDVLSHIRIREDKVELAECVSCQGEHPRDFILCDDHLLCANRFSNEVVCFRIGEDGKIGEVTDRIAIPEAVSLLSF